MILFLKLFFAFNVQAEEPSKDYTLPNMTIEMQSHHSPPPVMDRKIFAGKKSTLIPKSEQTTSPTNQYRQSLAQVPGLLISEVNNESYMSINYRGLGDPHESLNVLILRNGLPVAPDPYGYPAAYYAPPAEALDRTEFLSGGSGLLYGPQPGGTLNMILRGAQTGEKRFNGFTKNIAGSFSQYNSFTEASGGTESFGYLTSLNLRGSQGFRESNSDSKIENPRLNLAWQTEGNYKFSVDLDAFTGKFGEPGGLAKKAEAGLVSIEDGIDKTTTPHDRLAIDRQGLVAGIQKDWSASTGLDAQLWYVDYDRWSYRQNGGSFGKVASGATNTIQKQHFKTFGLDARLLHRYDFLDEEQSLSLNLNTLESKSPFKVYTGDSPTATEGTLIREIDRRTIVKSVAIENAFKFGAWNITPGLRSDSIDQGIHEILGGSLRREDKNTEVKLAGLGLDYQINDQTTTYANISQGYKPPSFQDTVPLSAGDTISEDIKEARVIFQELGIKKNYKTFFTDVSFFQIDYSNQFGRVGTQFQNVGRSKTEGAELSVVGAFNSQWKTFFNISLLKAQFIGGPLIGKTPQYSPDQTLKWGFNYSYKENSFVQLQVLRKSSHYGDDGNTENFILPESTIWDLSAEHSLSSSQTKNTKMYWGVQNLTNEKTWTRVRSNGIEPLTPRNFFAGFRWGFE